MPRYTFHNPTCTRIKIPGTQHWIDSRKNKVIDAIAFPLDNPQLNEMLQKGVLRMSETVESPLVSDHIETVVVDMLDTGGGGGGGLDPDDIRQDVTLAGALDGVNQVFTAPDTFVQDPPGQQIAVYWNGQRLILGDDYTVSGGGVGEGTTVTLVATPISQDKIHADYYVAP